MDKLIQGIRHFQETVYEKKKTLYKELAKGQKPKVLFISCSDSRVVPHLFTQTEPGDMFMVQNAGNIVPQHGSANGGVGASIEYAVAVLNVEHIVVCGHSNCGAMNAIASNQNLDALPSVKHWISFAEATRAIVQTQDKGLSDDARLELCIEQNIPVQLDHLRTLPSVAAKLVQNKVTLHGWVYHIETGRIDVWNPENKAFQAFNDAYPEPAKASV